MRLARGATADRLVVLRRVRDFAVAVLVPQGTVIEREAVIERVAVVGREAIERLDLVVNLRLRAVVVDPFVKVRRRGERFEVVRVLRVDLRDLFM